MFNIEECRTILLTECTYEVACLGGRVLLGYETQPLHGDEIYSVYFPGSNNELPYWCYLRNIKQISVDRSAESFFISIEAVKLHQWSDVVTPIINPKHGRFACLDDWHPSIKMKENRISYHNAYTRKECILYDFQLFNWQSFQEDNISTDQQIEK